MPDNGFKPDTTYKSYNIPILTGDTANNNLFAIEPYFSSNANQTVLRKSKWEKWYQNIFQSYNSNVVLYKKKTNLYFKNYYEDDAQTKYRTAVLRFSSSSDIDTLFKLVGHWGATNIFNWQGKTMINIYSNGGETVNYGPIAEITDTGLVKITDSRWSFLNGKYGSGIVYKNELYFTWQSYGSIAVLKSDKWEIVEPGINGGAMWINKALEYNKRLYIIGGFWKFENSNNPGNSIVAWDGQKWDSLEGGAKNNYISINAGFGGAVVCGDKLFLCGQFTDVGGLKSLRLVSWNDTSWCTLGGDLDSTFGMVEHLACLQDTLYASGDFGNVKGKNIGVVAKFVNINHVDSCGKPRYKIEYVPVDGFDFKYYPNPVKSKLTVEFMRSRVNVSKIIFTNSLGQLISIIDNPLQKQEIDLSFLNSGVYYLKVDSKEIKQVYKLVKE